MFKNKFVIIIPLIILIFSCGNSSKTQPVEELKLNVKSKNLVGLENEVDNLFKGEYILNSNYFDYKTQLAIKAYTFADKNPYKVAVILLKLTQKSGAADIETILPLLNENFIKYPCETVEAIQYSKKYFIKEYANDDFVNYLYEAIITSPFYKNDQKRLTGYDKELLLKDKKRITLLIEKSNIDVLTKKRVDGLINKIEIK